MLTSLSIRNVALIEQLTIDFKNGLCALTGETGAGKSILLDSLGLALGGRSESGLIRKGAGSAQVTAEFEVSPKHPVFALLKDADIETQNPLILRRSVTTDGRSRAFINDQPVSVGLLRSAGDMLVEIHGQFDTQGLLNPSTHRAMLDGYAGIGSDLPRLWEDYKSVERDLQAMKDAAAQVRNDETYLRQSIEDLDALDAKQGEEAELGSLRERLIHREKVLEALNYADEMLSGENDPVRKAWQALDRVASKIGEAGSELIATLERATHEIAEAQTQIRSLSADLQESGHDLESIDDRLHELKAQARKHNCTADELPAIREKLAMRLNMVEHGDEMLEAQMKKVEAARKAYAKEAEKAGQIRRKTAEKLDKLVQKELPPLKLDKARFVTAIDTLPESEWGPYGQDQVRFLVATNPGAEPGPINKIASGGEMARFMLALKVVMAEVNSAGSLIFDEVDTGIGGAVADAVGERLARLAQKRQVLVVTHAPQVAARAAHHWIVLKDGKDIVKTRIVALDEAPKRREEIARMLSGATITEEARAQAKKLLELSAA